ncbi:MAG: UDP-galactopyranose mutase [Nitrospirae bacterium]|nr:UDP-galactopyranose mutase [Nitrospirota bacterium]
MGYDYLIVGCGFAGAVSARCLADRGRKVLIMERRSHIGGNSYDFYNSFDILVHKYGPHYFRTNDKDVWQFLSGFTEWRYCQYVIKSCVDGQLFDFPVNLNTINQFYGTRFSSMEAKEFIEKLRVKIDRPRNSKEQVISIIGENIYNAFFKNYTIKQWGVDPSNLDASVTARIPVRFNKDPRYFESIYQAMPKEGYSKLFENMLDHPDISLMLNTDYHKDKDGINYTKLIYTGCIDEYFDFQFGKLPYRSLRFEFENYEQEYYQEYSQINYPNEYDFTRVVEIKHVTGQKISKTTIVREYPESEGEPYYPIPMMKNEQLYLKYKNEADKLRDTYFIGRLAQYKYLNMDQVVKESIDLINKLE